MGWASIANLVLTIISWSVAGLRFLMPYAKKSLPYVFCFILGWSACSNRIFTHHKAETLTSTETVIGIQGGNHITVESGLFGRKYTNLYLWGIEIPYSVEKQAQDNLANIVSKNDNIRVEVLESWGRYSGIIYANNGNNCCLEQLRAGLAKTTVDRKDFNMAQKEAQKNRRGIWK